jgi:hypothetical protein
VALSADPDGFGFARAIRQVGGPGKNACEAANRQKAGRSENRLLTRAAPKRVMYETLSHEHYTITFSEVELDREL